MLPYLSVSALICPRSCPPPPPLQLKREKLIENGRSCKPKMSPGDEQECQRRYCVYVRSVKLIASWHAGRKLGWGKEKCRQRELTVRERGGMRGARANGWDLRNTEGRVCRLPSLTRLMAARRQHVCSVFAPRALVPLCFYVPLFLFFSFFYSSAAWTMWSNTPTKPHSSHTETTHTQFSLYSRRGNVVGQLSSLGSLVEP